MKHILVRLALVAATAGLFAQASMTQAGEPRSTVSSSGFNMAVPDSVLDRASSKRPIGGYSYSPADVMDGSNRPYLGRSQSLGGPFDSGFFFDSGTGWLGGNSPYLK